MKKLDSIQILRAVAALLVVFCHGAAEIGTNSPALWPSVWHTINNKGLFGVDIFFVVSGFVMMHIIFGQPPGGASAARFIGERAVRVVPLYWLTTLLSVAIGVLAPALKHKHAFSAPYVLRSLLFTPSINPATGAPEPVLGLGWTLNYEMFFYAIIALILLLGVRRVFPALLVVFVSLVVFGAWFQPDDIIVKSWTHSIILEFLYGALLAQLRLSGWRIGALAQCVFVSAGVGGWLLLDLPAAGHFDLRGIVWGLSAAAIFCGFVMGRSQIAWPKGFTLIGDASYSLYLTHLFVMRICSMLVYHLPVGAVLQAVLFLLVFPPAAMALSVISYRKFELPTMKLGRQLIDARLNRRRLIETA